MIKSWTICRNCGGEYGLHRSDDNACPCNGEDQMGRKSPYWMATKFQEVDERDIEIADLRAALTAAQADARYHIEKRDALTDRIIELEAENAKLREALTNAKHLLALGRNVGADRLLTIVQVENLVNDALAK